MLYNYKFTLNEMAKIKNYKKEKKFKHTLLGIENLEFSTYEISFKIDYKKTVPLNIFEKYAIRLIKKANDIYSEINISKIAKLLHLDENLIKDNLENLEEIEMLDGINSDIITINKDENSIYLQYENKFKIESIKKTHHLTKTEYEDMDNYILNVFEKDNENKDKKFKSFEILDEKESSKDVTLLNYNNDKFLLFSNYGINNQNDLKFIDDDTFNTTNVKPELPIDIFCHYEEFLPLLRDILAKNENEIVIIGSKNIDEDNLDIFKIQKNMQDLFILSNEDDKDKRIFNIDTDDFVFIGKDLYTKKDDFIVKSNNIKKQKDIKIKLETYFKTKISLIEPSYFSNERDRLDKQLKQANQNISELEYSTKKEFDNKIEEKNIEKNELYGFDTKNKANKKKQRKIIDAFEDTNNQKQLNKYPNYLENRDTIITLKNKVKELEKRKINLQNNLDKINKLNKQKNKLISHENIENVKLLEDELNKLKKVGL
jgi:hypothetical protein